MRHLLLITVFALGAFSCTTKKSPPNFVFILVDDLGWADVQCLNPECFYDTPNIDKLAEEGILFTQGYAAHSVCSPSRAAIMTGKHPNRLDITDYIPGDDPKNRPLLGPQDRSNLALEEVSLAEALKVKGYKTCFIGKWHLGLDGFQPEDQGFDINIGGYERPPGGYYSPYNVPKLPNGPVGEYLPDRLTNECINFILDQKNKKEPFLAYLSFYTVHTPIQASKRYVEYYKKKYEQMGIQEVQYRKEGNGLTRLTQSDTAYASMVTAMDENVGRLMDVLKGNGMLENTWVIFTSDNGGLSTKKQKGTPTSNEPLRAGKGWCYEGGIRVPVIILGPGVKNPGRTVIDPVIGMDFFPTIMELAGIENVAKDGISLIPIVKGNGKLERDGLLWHYPHYHGSEWTPGSSLRKGDWKIVVHYENNQYELYNLAKDPYEKADISTTYPDKLNELKELLDEKLKKTDGKLPIKNPYYKGN